MKDAMIRPLDPEERARISAAYGALVKPDVSIQKVPRGHGVLFQPRPVREQTEGKWRAMVRRRRVGAAKPWDGGREG